MLKKLEFSISIFDSEWSKECIDFTMMCVFSCVLENIFFGEKKV